MTTQVYDGNEWIKPGAVWRGSAVYGVGGAEGHVISPTTSDDLLEVYAEELEAEARDDDVILDPGALEALRALRDEAQKREAERED